MVLQKKAVTIPLKALMGLLFAAILIFAVIIAIGKFTDTENPAKEYILYVAKELNNFDDVGRITEIIAPEVDQKYLITLFSQGKATVDNTQVQNSACKESSCICIYEPKKKKIVACESIKYPEITAKGVARTHVEIRAEESDYSGILADRYFVKLTTPRSLEWQCNIKEGACEIK